MGHSPNSQPSFSKEPLSTTRGADPIGRRIIAPTMIALGLSLTTAWVVLLAYGLLFFLYQNLSQFISGMML
jgi:hypothetical protein